MMPGSRQVSARPGRARAARQSAGARCSRGMKPDNQNERTPLSMKGEKIYEYDLKITGVTDYGLALQSIVSGQSPVPPQGARIDVAFEGRAAGRLTGRVRGVDYLKIRADGRMDLDIRAVIETEDGHRIALTADGVATLRAGEPIVDLAENVILTTAAEKYAWVHTRQIWATGTVNLAVGEIHLDAYLQ